MRGKDLLDKMELIAPEYIEAAEARPKKSKLSWVKWAGAAACIAAAVVGTTLLLPKGQEQINAELPMLSISENMSACGFEGYMAYDVSELVNSNPWNENFSVSTLPVYKNQVSSDDNHNMTGGDFDEMKELALEVAQRLGLDKANLVITDDSPDEDYKKKVTEKFESLGQTVPQGCFAPTKVIVKTDGIEIEVDMTMTATVLFEPSLSLLPEHNFTHFASYEQKATVAEYLKTQYKDLIGFENPQVIIYGGDYNIYGQQMFSIGFFDASADETEKIINYNFNRIEFHCDDDGKLFIARLYRPDLTAKAGDYPLISVQEAKELLLNGNYISDVMYELMGEEYIKKTELIYRLGVHEEYFMPYYRFYVELPQVEKNDGMKTYGAFYVPAVKGAYISNMPVWGGESFVIDPSEK